MAAGLFCPADFLGHSGDDEVWDGMYEGTRSKTKEMLVMSGNMMK